MSVDRIFSPGPVVCVIARLRRTRLDEALSQGADPATTPLIAARARQLARPATRARLAAGLERLALSADDGSPRGRARILPSRTASAANRARLLEIASVLRDDTPLYARGLAALELALTDGTGPAYTDRRGEALTCQLRHAQAGLSGTA